MPCDAMRCDAMRCDGGRESGAKKEAIKSRAERASERDRAEESRRIDHGNGIVSCPCFFVQAPCHPPEPQTETEMKQQRCHTLREYRLGHPYSREANNATATIGILASKYVMDIWKWTNSASVMGKQLFQFFCSRVGIYLHWFREITVLWHTN